MGAKSAELRPAATSRRYPPEQKEQAVRMALALRAELGTTVGTVTRAARQPGYGIESERSGWPRPRSMPARVLGSRLRRARSRGGCVRIIVSFAGRTRSSSGRRLFSGRSPTADSDDRAVRRREPWRVRSRARLRSVGGGPVHALVSQAPAAVGPGAARRRADAAAVGAVARRLPGPWDAQAVGRRPASGP